jgi:hypothetical protein
MEGAMKVGGCLCGQVRYRCDEVGPLSYCHCSDCRKATGSAFNVGARVSIAGFHVQGPTAAFTKTGDSGRELTRHFCPQCGSPIWTSSPFHPDLVFVKAGTFDDPDLPAATHESWVGSRVELGSDSVGCRKLRGR